LGHLALFELHQFEGRKSFQFIGSGIDEFIRHEFGFRRRQFDARGVNLSEAVARHTLNIWKSVPG
jgi:hypothetical protein